MNLTLNFNSKANILLLTISNKDGDELKTVMEMLDKEHTDDEDIVNGRKA